ncbi:hypothetical protein GCM10009839_20130 [Catenulispora yoronensis]|uniref:DUF4190 domain-containing protein n=1 Tax=Catenulispora yoronensis TaxID=450799 RepID=A0ABN2TVN1_9ACTN
MSYNPEGDAASGNPIQDRIPEGYPPPNAWHAPGGEAPPTAPGFPAPATLAGYPAPDGRGPVGFPAPPGQFAQSGQSGQSGYSEYAGQPDYSGYSGQSVPPGFPAPPPGPAQIGYGPGPQPGPPPGYGPPAPGYGPPGYGPPAPGYGPPGYPPPPYGPYLVRKTNGMAVTGMVLGIVSLVLFWAWFFGPVLAVLGLIFSGVGISQCGRTGQEGKGMAIAGLVCSLISASLWVLLVIAVESFVHSL